MRSPRNSSIKDYDNVILAYITQQKFLDALELLVIVYQGPIVRFCTGMLGNKEEGEDIGQEVFLAAYRGMPHFQQNSSVGTWLFAIARYQCFNALRKRNRRYLTPKPTS
jgi:DNA-directed RNA polymerase specialized sigma subunit, sigma24 homolog